MNAGAVPKANKSRSVTGRTKVLMRGLPSERTLVYPARVEPRLLLQIRAAPQVQRQQGSRAGAHGVRFVARVMNGSSRRLLTPRCIALLPPGGAAQGHIELLGFVTVARVVRGRTQQEKTAGDALCAQGSARAQDLA